MADRSHVFDCVECAIYALGRKSERRAVCLSQHVGSVERILVSRTEHQATLI